jgi:hypothetical protein
MPKFEPARDGWSLCEAVRRTAAPWALAALHRDMIDAAETGIQHEPVEWWHWTDPPPPPPAPAHNPPRPVPVIEAYGRRYLLPYGIEVQFRHKLDTGELLYWGRPGSVLAEYRRVPPYAGAIIVSWWETGGILRLKSGEVLYSVRVERLGEAKTNLGGSPGLPYKDKVIAQTVEWLDQEGEQPLPEIRKFVSNLAAEIDDSGGPVRNTLVSWAERALTEYRKMRETGEPMSKT